MKKFYALFLLFSSVALNAQSSQKVGYQAVVRDGQGNLIINKNIGVRLTIMQEGVEVYQETHLSKTNANGLFSLEIGGGTVISGNFGTINWGNGKRTMLESAIDLNGGWNYTLFSLTDVLSVPYAIHAQTAQRLVENPQETDPVFLRSPASRIADTNIRNWNAKQNTLQAGEGITIINDTIRAVLAFAEAETDPLFQQHLAYSLTERDTAYWNNKLDNADLEALKTEINAKADTTYFNALKNDVEVLQQTKADTAYVNAKMQNSTVTIDTTLLNGLIAKIEALEKTVEDLQIANGILVKDIDGNVYKTQKYGTQTWMIENLRVTKWNDGTPIEYVQDSLDWINKLDVAPNLEYLAPPMYCFIDTTAENRVKYGASYNWFVIDPANSKQLCPVGWRVPALNDWEILLNQLIKDGYNFDGTTTENKIAKSMAIGNDWLYSDRAGSPGNPDYPEKRNSSNFSVYPTGDRWATGQFVSFGSRGAFWSTSTRSSYGQVMGQQITVYSIYALLHICPYGTHKADARSIRCVKNSDLSSTEGMKSELEHLQKVTEGLQIDNETLKSEVEELKQTVEDLQIANGTIVKDIDGNIYKTQKYGNQTWMIENLRVTRYNDKTPIDYVQDNTEWTNKHEIVMIPYGSGSIGEWVAPPMYCFQDTTINGKVKYGAAYNWFTVDPANGKQLCPDGWRVPALSDWETLIQHLINSGYNYDGTTTGNKVGKSMAIGNEWEYSDLIGSPGNTDYQEKKNASNFSAVPVGYRSRSGNFTISNGSCYWWSTDFHHYTYNMRYGKYASVRVDRTSLFICPYGFIANTANPIRCIKDSDLSQPNTLNSELEQCKKTVEDLETANEILKSEIEQKDSLLLANGYIKDIDDNWYKTVKIGTQTWMSENLRVTKYNDKTPISYVQDNSEWSGKIEKLGNDFSAPPMYCFVDTSIYGIITYGALYNWFTINPANGKQLCPIGWRIPSLDDFNVLNDYLINNGYNYDDTKSGNKIGKSMAMGSWEYSNIVGSPGNTDYPQKKNTSKFSAIPAGNRDRSGIYIGLNQSASWWCTNTAYYSGMYTAVYASVSYNGEYLTRCSSGTLKPTAMSIRCIKD